MVKGRIYFSRFCSLPTYPPSLPPPIRRVTHSKPSPSKEAGTASCTPGLCTQAPVPAPHQPSSRGGHSSQGRDGSTPSPGLPIALGLVSTVKHQSWRNLCFTSTTKLFWGGLACFLSSHPKCRRVLSPGRGWRGDRR